MARAREPTISECLFTVLLFALIQTITAKDAAVVRYEERESVGVVVKAGLVRVRRQVPVASTITPTTAPPGNGTETDRTPGNDTTKNDTGVTNAPVTPTPTPTPSPTTTAQGSTQAPVRTTLSPLPTTTANVTISENDVKYYTVTTLHHHMQTVQKYWKNLSNGSEVHPTLSDGHRLAQTLPLKFEFRFYGHTINNVTIATGGFLYMSPFLHKFLTATQYIAPLMANFDTSLGSESHIRYLSTTEIFIVQWENVHLKDQVEFGIFNFQVHLKKSGDILFVYKNVPISVNKIVEDNHPVKVGLSDAFYIDKDDKKLGMKRRTIYEYHRVQINFTQVTNNTVVILKPNPTCNTARTCESCLDNLAAMGCRWCGVVQRCSDGIDWMRQDWLNKGCKYLSGNDNCSAIATVQPTKAPLTKRGDGIGFPPGAVIAIIIIVALVIGIGGWLFYAYRNPTSPSGMWLMEHRPDAMKTKLAKMKFWKQSTPTGDKYAVESEA
ncbi:plexin domain-containing protein 2-like isoform X4 [Liolophura sinensis]|uniref:plexin domain-containing protein 2-like isoform X4 n=1 Tax=Liolophura sinensis TaxID=3198878 RepID=UPI0031583782